MFLRTLLVIFVGITAFVQARPSPIPKVFLFFPNATSTTLLSTSTLGRGDSAPTSGSPNPGKFPPLPKSSSVCCFLVQDTISEEWWADFSASTTYGLVTVTTITTYLSRGPDGIGTIYSSDSSVDVVTTDFVFYFNIAVNPLATLYNAAPGPTEDKNALTGTATMTGGVLVQSPAAFYVYNSVKIITAAAVTDEVGNVMCGTTHFDYPNINSNAGAYYAGPSIEGEVYSSSIVKTTVTSTITFIEPIIFTTTPTMIEFIVSSTTYYTNSAGHTVKPSPNQPGSVISLTTPFIWQAPWGATGARTPSGKCKRASSSEQYGYIPQTLLDYLVENPYYRSQYPGLKSCLPGGPSLIFPLCDATGGSPPKGPLPSTVALPAGGGLTSESTVYGIPDTTMTPAPGGLGGTSLPTSPSNVWPNPTPTPDQSPPPTPNQNPPPPNSAHGFLTTILNPPAPGPVPFSTTVVSGTSLLIIPATTLPLSLAPSGLSGITITISSTPYLIIPTLTSISLYAPSPNGGSTFAISTTTINGIPYILVPSPSGSPSPAPQELEGWLTTVSDGVGFVIADAMTVPASEVSGLDVKGSGKTTVMGGSTEIVFSGGMTMMLGTSGSVSATTVTSLVAQSGKNAAATTARSSGGRLESGWIGWAGVFVVVILGL